MPNTFYNYITKGYLNEKTFVMLFISHMGPALTNFTVIRTDRHFLLPGTLLLQWPVRDRTEPHQTAGLSAGFLSGTAASCLPEDQWSPAD